MSKPIEYATDIVTSHGKPPRSQGVGRHVDDRPPEVMSPEHRELVLVGLEQSRRGEIATDEEVRSIFASFRQ